MDRSSPRVGLALALAISFLPGCGDGRVDPATADSPTSEAAAAQVPAAPDTPPYGFSPWHADFPGAPARPHLSPRQAGRTYDRTRRQALESVVKNLEGACSREAWLFARDLCGRLTGDDVLVLVEALDQALQSKERNDWAENILASLAVAKAPSAAEAILRALESPSDALRTGAMEALAGCGTPETVLAAGNLLDRVGPRGLKAWAEAARRFLAPADIVAGYRRILVEARRLNVQSPVADLALLLPVEQALAVFEPFGDDVPIAVRSRLIALHQAAGDVDSRIALRDMLLDRDPQVRRQAVAVLPLAHAEELLAEILPLSADPDPMVRFGVVAALARIRNDDVDLALDSLATDAAVEVRRAALAELVKRQRRGVLDDLALTVRSGTGAAMSLAMQDLVAARDPGSIPAFVSRMTLSPAGERASFLRAIALTTAAEGFSPLWTAFLSDDQANAEHRELISILLANCRGAEAALLESFRALEKTDHRRRALAMNTLANVALDRGVVEIAAPIFAELRRITADPGEIPQLRLLALELTRRDLTLDDQARVRGMLRNANPGMRDALADFLFEFF